MSESLSQVDVVVVGSGAGGMTAALTAALDGCSVLLIEASDHFGGTTAISGGAIWIPDNPLLEAAGESDSIEDAERYMAELAGDTASAAHRRTYLRAGPDMVRDFDQRTRWVRWRAQGTPDYFSERPGARAGGRTIAPAIVDGSALGELRPTLRPPSAAMDVRPLTITAEDLGALRMIARSARGKKTAVKVVARSAWGLLARREPLGIGQALCARLRLGLRDAGVTVWLSAPMVELTTGGSTPDAAVTGVRVRRREPDGSPGEEVVVRARRGVVLAAGSFSRNQEMRAKHLPRPTDARWSLAPPEGQNGDAIQAAVAVGAATAMMDCIWGMPVLIAPVRGTMAPLLTQWERSLPGVIVVDRTGARYAEETLPYEEFWKQMYAREEINGAAVPSWLVFDQRVKNRYLFLRTLPLAPFPRSYRKQGVLHTAQTVEALAERLGVSPASLTASVRRYNAHVAAGRDTDFGRGETRFAKAMGDPRLAQPNLAPIDHPPFYAMPLYPGDLGTKGGLVTDDRGRVLRADGSLIPGLHAVGNCAAAMAMGTSYPGAGATIGNAMVFGYLSGKELSSGSRSGAATMDTMRR